MGTIQPKALFAITQENLFYIDISIDLQIGPYYTDSISGLFKEVYGPYLTGVLFPKGTIITF